MLLAKLNPQSNRADWVEAIEFVDDDPNEAGVQEHIDLTGCSIIITVKDQDGCQVLSASTDDGSVAIVSLGIAEFSFPRSRMASLQADTYDVGGTVSRDNFTMQFLIGQVPVMDGVVQR